MKILFILHLPSPVHGSSVVGKQVADLAGRQTDLDSRFINLSTSASVDDIGRMRLRKLTTYLTILGKTFFALLSKRWDRVYIAITVKGAAFYKDVLVVGLVKLFRRPIIYHLHNKGVATRQNRFLDKWLYRFVFRKSKVILLSKYLYPDISRFVKDENVYFCPNGIPDPLGHLVDRSNRSGPPIVLFLSNLIESKGVYVLLQACKLLKERGIAFHCQFVGGEGDIRATEFNAKVSELGLSDCVTYLGKKFGKDKDAIFEGADLFVLPTHYHNECMPLVLLEAMAWGLPVVSTPEGGIPDVVIDGETGFLVQQQDSSALAAKLEAIIKDPELSQRMGTVGRIRYENFFTERQFMQVSIKILKG